MPALLLPLLRRLSCLAALLLAALAAPGAGAQALDDPLAKAVQEMALAGAAGQPLPDRAPVRFEVSVGQLDPRLKLAPCQRIEPYLPAGARPIGRTRVGLRCVQGEKPWNVFLPVQVRAYTTGWTSASALAAGTVLDTSHLQSAEIDLGEGSGTPVLQPEQALGRVLSRPLAAGSTLRLADLRPRQFFAAGDRVAVRASGSGFEVATEGEALNPGFEGQPVRVRVEGGRTISGRAVGDKQVDTLL